MPEQVSLPPVAADDAIAKLTAWLRDIWTASRPNFFPLRAFILYELEGIWVAREPGRARGQPANLAMDEHTNAAPYYDAAWELTRRGVLVPARREVSKGDYEFTGEHFRLTPYGQAWLAQVSDLPLPTDYGRFSTFLHKHARRFRPSYELRSREALSCYRSSVYLACCVMCGAAAESILLSLAVAKTGEEAKVLAEYRKATGRTNIRNLLAGTASHQIQRDLDTFLELLKYWRDEAAHAGDLKIDEEEAFMALLLLLRFARFADERWDEIT